MITPTLDHSVRWEGKGGALPARPLAAFEDHVRLPAELERIVQTIIDRVKLARRLHDVFRAIVLGWDIRETGQDLGLADNTVRLYRQHVYDALRPERATPRALRAPIQQSSRRDFRALHAVQNRWTATHPRP